MSLFADLKVGDRVKFPGDGYVWTIKDRDDRYIVATARGRYTVVDLTGWQHKKYNGAGNGVVRSSLDTLGGGWDLKNEGVMEIIPALRSGEWDLSARRVMDARTFELLS